MRDVSEELFLTYRYYISSSNLCFLLLQHLRLPPLEKLTISEQEVTMRRHLITRRKVMELIRQWFVLHHKELRRDLELKKVIFEFTRTTTLLCEDEAFFFITLLRKFFQPVVCPHLLFGITSNSVIASWRQS